MAVAGSVATIATQQPITSDMSTVHGGSSVRDLVSALSPLHPSAIVSMGGELPCKSRLHFPQRLPKPLMRIPSQIDELDAAHYPILNAYDIPPPPGPPASAHFHHHHRHFHHSSKSHKLPLSHSLSGSELCPQNKMVSTINLYRDSHGRFRNVGSLSTLSEARLYNNNQMNQDHLSRHLVLSGPNSEDEDL